MQTLKCLFGIDDNTAATIIITLSIFILGYVVNGVNNLIVAYIRRRNYRRIFSDIMETVAREIGRQSEMFLTSAASFNIENSGDYIVKTITITHMDNIDKLDFKDVYNAHFTGVENLFVGLKLKAFNKTYNNISLVKGIEDKLAQRVNFFNGKLDEYQSKWDEHLGLLRQLLDNIVVEQNGQQLPREVADYFEGMDRIVRAWQLLPNRLEYSIMKRQFIDRLLNHNREHQALRFQGNPILQMNTLLLNVAHDYENLAKTLQVYSDEFTHNYYLYRVSHRVINKAIKFLK